MALVAHAVAFLAFLLLPGYVFLRAPTSPTHRSFGALGVAGVVFNGFSLAALWGASPEARLQATNMAYVGAFLLLPIVSHFPSAFLGPGRYRPPRWLVPTAWITAGIFTALALGGGFLQRITPEGVAAGGWAVPLWTLTIGTAFVHFAVVLRREARRSEDGELENRVHYLILGAVAYAVPGFLDLLYRSGFPHLLPFLPFPLAPWGSLGFLVCVGVAVIKHRLLDIEVVLHRGLVLSLSAPVLATCFVVTGELLEGAFRGSMPPDSPFPDLLAAMVVAMLFSPLSELLGRFVETFVLTEFKVAPGLRRFRQLPWLIGAEDVEGLKELRDELDGIITRLGDEASTPPGKKSE